MTTKEKDNLLLKLSMFEKAKELAQRKLTQLEKAVKRVKQELKDGDKE